MGSHSKVMQDDYLKQLEIDFQIVVVVNSFAAGLSLWLDRFTGQWIVSLLRAARKLRCISCSLYRNSEEPHQWNTEYNYNLVAGTRFDPPLCPILQRVMLATPIATSVP